MRKDHFSTSSQHRYDSYESDTISASHVTSRNTILSDDFYSVRGFQSSRGSLDDHSDDHVSQSGDEAETTHVSYLGPKMRVHGRAPWEITRDYDSAHDRSLSPDGMSIFGTRKSGKSALRGIALGSGRSMRSPSIPRLSSDSFSTSSQKGKVAKSSQAALQALAYASMSSTSISLGSSPIDHRPSQDFFDYGGRRSSPTISIDKSSDSELYKVNSRSALSPTYRAAASIRSSPASRGSRPNSQERSIPTDKTQFQHVSTYSAMVHPYANPDILSSSISDDTHDLEATSTNDHNTVCGYQVASPGSSTQAIRPTSKAGSALTSTVNGAPRKISSLRSISGPSNLLVNGANVDTEFRNSLGAGDGVPIGQSSSMNLISLEEAQARANTRIKYHQVASSPKHSLSLPFPVDNNGSPSEQSRMFRGRARSRTASSGNKRFPFSPASELGKSQSRRKLTETSSVVYDLDAPPSPSQSVYSEASPRTLKQKRSGFLKLFSAKEREKPAAEEVPPLPQMAHFLDYNNRNGISPLVTGSSESNREVQSDLSASFSSSSSNHTQNIKNFQTVKRVNPGLSIEVLANLASSTSSISPNHSAKPLPFIRLDESTTLLDKFGKPQNPATLPASAPPGTTQFKGLSLRPVSSLFSGQFMDHLLSEQVPLTDSPAITEFTWTPSSLSSPVTPGSSKEYSLVLPDSTRERQSTGASVLSEQKVAYGVDQDLQISDLEEQVRKLQATVRELQTGGWCAHCGRGGYGEKYLKAVPSDIVTRSVATIGNTTLPISQG